jgi:hypothetical protein
VRELPPWGGGLCGWAFRGSAGAVAKGSASLRDAKKKKVKEDLFHLRDDVQSAVETNAR